MFFLGIAGPLMPYFLVTGILVLFTLGVSMEKLYLREEEPVDNPHFLIAGESGTSLPEATCHYFDLTDKFSHQDFAEALSQGKTYFTPPEITGGVTFMSMDDSLSAEDYSGRYFGLSPPSSFVS